MILRGSLHLRAKISHTVFWYPKATFETLSSIKVVYTPPYWTSDPRSVFYVPCLVLSQTVIKWVQANELSALFSKGKKICIKFVKMCNPLALLTFSFAIRRSFWRATALGQYANAFFFAFRNLTTRHSDELQSQTNCALLSILTFCHSVSSPWHFDDLS